MRRPAVLASAVLTVAVAGSMSACQPVASPAPNAGPVTGEPATGAMITNQLRRVGTIRSLPLVAGYDRACGAGHACTFGSAWTDDNDGPSGHDGCDERNQTLRTQLHDVRFKAGSNCVVVSGVLDDPYTGKTIRFDKSDAARVQVDHRVPLARAFALGANTWTRDQRVAFANDTATELVAVDGPTNQSKSDHGLEWLPPNRAYRCRYVYDYLAVSAKYGLPITDSDQAAAQAVARGC